MAPKTNHKALLTFGIGTHEPLLQYSVPAMKRYAEIHNYRFIEAGCSSDHRPPPWGKIPAIQKALKQYQTVLWIDCDVMIVKFDVDIGYGFSDQAFQGLVKHHTNCGEVPNTGVWLLRNCARTNQMLEYVWNQKDLTNHMWWEQAAVMRLLGYTDTIPAKIRQASDYHVETQWLGLEWNSHPDCAHPEPRFKHITYNTVAQRLPIMQQLAGAVSA